MQPFFETRRYTPRKPVRAWTEESFDFLAHWQEDIEFVFVLEGAQGVGIESSFRELRAGDVAVVGSQRVHYYRRGEPGRVVLVFADAEYLREQLDAPDALASLPAFLTLPQAAPLFQRLAAEEASGERHREIAMKAALLELLLLVLRSPCPADGVQFAAEPPMGGVAKIREALSILEEEFAEDLTMADVARRVGLSPSHFSRRFSRATGMGFRPYLNRLRVHHAEQRLAEGAGTITDIAMACGFQSLRTFHRAFRDTVGHAPHARYRSGAGSGDATGTGGAAGQP